MKDRLLAEWQRDRIATMTSLVLFGGIGVIGLIAASVVMSIFAPLETVLRLVVLAISGYAAYWLIRAPARCLTMVTLDTPGAHRRLGSNQSERSVCPWVWRPSR